MKDKKGESIVKGNRFIQRMTLWLMILLLAVPPWSYGQTGQVFNKEELAQMLAPIALYPDSLLAQVLMASTYPLDVVEADRWLKENKSLKGDALNAALAKESWDPSIKALISFPDVLALMNNQLDWTQKLGKAFVAQQSDVMDMVQTLRAKASSEGSLKTTKEQKVVVENNVIAIEPATQVVYVPAYNPVVYGTWAYPSYPPYSYYPPGYGASAAVAGALTFGAGVAVGAAWNNSWGAWNWGNHTVNVNRNVTVNSASFNSATVNRNTMNTTAWHHDATRSGAVAYGSRTNVQGAGWSSSSAAVSRSQAGQAAESRGYGRYGNTASQAGVARESSEVRSSAFSGISEGGAERSASVRGVSSRSAGGFSREGGGGFSREGRGGFSRGGGGRRR